MALSLEELLLNDEFRQWVLRPNDAVDQQWNIWLATASLEDQDVIRQG